MPEQAFLKGIAAYWGAVGQPGDAPELGASRIDAFVDLLHLTSGAENAFRLLETLDSPYPGIAVGDDSRPWKLHWAIQVGELEPFVVPGLDDTIFVADTIADPDGRHRVYSLRDGLRGSLEFADIAHALEWMSAYVQHAKGAIDDAALQKVQETHGGVPSDGWESGPTSGVYILEELVDSPLLDAWRAISRGQWPMVEPSEAVAPVDREDGWQRRLSLWLANRFVEARVVELPADVSVSDMDAVHRNLVEHLSDFEQAIHGGDVPSVVNEASVGDDSKLRTLALDWIEQHDGWRTAANVPSPEDDLDEEAEPPPFQHTPFTRKLMQALSTSLDAMVADGEIELDPDRKEALLIELVTAGSDARSVKHMLKKITATLVESEHVEEIYPSDAKIQARLRTDLGG